jgi:ribosome-interacting GTPase 1
MLQKLLSTFIGEVPRVVPDDRVSLACHAVKHLIPTLNIHVDLTVKIDIVSLEDVIKLSNEPDSVCISCNLKLGTDYFLEKLWDYLELVRVYTKKVKNNYF